MTAITFDYSTDVVRSLGRLVFAMPKQAFNAIAKSYRCAKAEAELNAMDSHMLADIGVARGEIHSKVWGKF